MRSLIQQNEGQRIGLLASLLLAASILLACAGGNPGAGTGAVVTRPAQLDLATTQLSQNGLYRIRFAADQEPVPVSKLHTWTVHVDTAAGTAVADAVVSVEGGMPEHNHGMPTQPQVTSLGGGDYLVEGMKFQMPGWWTVTVAVEVAGQTDRATFNLLLN